MRHVSAVCACTWRHHASGKEIGIFLLFTGFWLKILPHLNITAIHNLKTRSLGIILTPWAMFVPISAFLLFLVSDSVEKSLIFTVFYLACFCKFCHD